MIFQLGGRIYEWSATSNINVGSCQIILKVVNCMHCSCDDDILFCAKLGLLSTFFCMSYEVRARRWFVRMMVNHSIMIPICWWLYILLRREFSNEYKAWINCARAYAQPSTQLPVTLFCLLQQRVAKAKSVEQSRRDVELNRTKRLWEGNNGISSSIHNDTTTATKPGKNKYAGRINTSCTC